MTFEYDRLDADATYRVCVALVRPQFTARFGAFQPQRSESLYANEHCLARDIELPMPACELFELDVPHDATRDGRVKRWFQKAGDASRPQLTVWRNTGGWGTLAAEVWLLKNTSQ